MNKIYVVLIKALTGLGQFARAVNGYEYTHVAVSLDKGLTDFVTFSRRKHYTPFDAGFMHESRDCYAFGDNEWVGVKVYEVPVTDDGLRRIHEYIKELENTEHYFNLYSMVTMGVVHGFRIPRAENCMSFTAKVLELGGVPLEKPYYRYSIKDIDSLLRLCSHRKCRLYKRAVEKPDYMEKADFRRNIEDFVKLNLHLIRRIR